MVSLNGRVRLLILMKHFDKLMPYARELKSATKISGPVPPFIFCKDYMIALALSAAALRGKSALR